MDEILFEAIVIKSFTWSKRHDKKYRINKPITDLTQEDVDYLLANKVIANVKPMKTTGEVKVEKAVEKAKVEKAVKKTTKKK